MVPLYDGFALSNTTRAWAQRYYFFVRNNQSRTYFFVRELQICTKIVIFVRNFGRCALFVGGLRCPNKLLTR